MANELKELITQRVELTARLRDEAEKHKEECASIESELLEVLSRIADCAADGLSPKSTLKKRTKPKPKEPDHDAVAKKYADFEPCATGCLCGCGEDVASGSNFVKGHHPRLKSISSAVDAGKLSAHKMSDAGYTYAVSQGWIDKGDS